MHIGLTDEQLLLRDTVAGLADTMASTGPADILNADALARQWQRIVEVGLPALRAPEACGLDASGVETAIALEELARRLSAVPALGQAIMAAELLNAAGADKEIDLMAEGALRAAPVLTIDLADFAGSAETGVLLDAAGATHALIVDRQDDRRKVLCAPLEANATAGYNGLDLTRSMRPIATIELDSATPVGELISTDRWATVIAMALTAISADQLGVMAGALDDAVRYAGERVQFGVKIGTFQSIQHLLADCLVRVEGARSCVFHAAWAVDHLPPNHALLSARTAKAYTAAAGRDVVETAMQVLGGISITWEHAAHLRLRRTLLNRRLFGDETTQFEAIAAMRLADRELN